jgi:hypothetical protein
MVILFAGYVSHLTNYVTCLGVKVIILPICSLISLALIVLIFTHDRHAPWPWSAPAIMFMPTVVQRELNLIITSKSLV